MDNLKIAPSVLEADYGCLREQLKMLEDAGADLLHFDVMDGCFVPSLSFGPRLVAALRTASSLPFDVHMMVKEPGRFAKQMRQAGADILTVHYEACEDVRRTLRDIRALGMKTGVVLKPDTPVSVIDRELLELSDVIQLMTREPGVDGVPYRADSAGRIRQLRSLMEEYGRILDIEVDGGINEHTIAEVTGAGANIIVSGTALFGGDTRQEIRKLRAAAV